MARGQKTKATLEDTNPDGGATTGYETELWAMADALRGSMDAAEYKHVVGQKAFETLCSGSLRMGH